MSPQKEQFIAWLNDAYSTELALMPVLKNHAADAEEYPEIHDRNMRHLEETRSQAERLEQLITSLGGKVSTAKSLFGTMLGQGQSISTEFFQDEITKNFLADYAAEHFEIASYKALIETARQIGEHQCIPVLEDILREEEAMARWIEEHLPLAIRIGLEKTTTSNGGRRRRSSGFYGKLQQNQALSTVVIGGAIGAVALYLMNSNKNQHQTRQVQKIRHIPHREVEGTAGRHISTATTETGSIATDESGSSTAEIRTSDNLTRAAKGNSR
ncbi:MAG TPA: ferritin-like domain-containing protein [Pyrinomonadaceae bacterium]|jgi:ferritin-like metal-binding protein YciE